MKILLCLLLLGCSTATIHIEHNKVMENEETKVVLDSKTYTVTDSFIKSILDFIRPE